MPVIPITVAIPDELSPKKVLKYSSVQIIIKIEELSHQNDMRVLFVEHPRKF